MAPQAANIPAPSPFSRQRRGTSPAHFEYREPVVVPSAAPLGLPTPSFLQDLTGSLGGRSLLDSPTSEDGTDERSAADVWGDRQQRDQRNRSNSTVSGFVDLAARVGNAMSSITSQPRSPISRSFTPSSHPSDAELEAEAIREREHSRREAERILLMEAEERRRAENRSQPSLTPPVQVPSRPRRDTIDVSSTSVRASGESSTSPSGSRWWTMAKQKLSPTKDSGPLTPAQEIIREAKIREKEARAEMEMEKERLKEGKNSWPASPKEKHNDPTYLAIQNTSPKMNSSVQQSPRISPQLQHLPRSNHQSPSIPAKMTAPMTPPQVPSSSRTTPLNFSPSPAPLAVGSSRAGTEQPLMYAQFNRNSGALDVPATLLTVAARFEKLEKWTINHVRALEERMKDVEKYLVDRESREDEMKKEVLSIRSSLQLVEAQVAETKASIPLAISPPSVDLPPVLNPPIAPGSPHSATTSTTSTGTFHSAPDSPAHTGNTFSLLSPQLAPSSTMLQSPLPVKGSENTGPTGTVKSINFRSRLPYPSGDYYDASPNQVSQVSLKSITPPPLIGSQRSQEGSPVLPMMRSVSPLALSPIDFESGDSGREQSKQDAAKQPPLVVPANPQPRSQAKTPSPTPRKRYTVALSGRQQDEPGDRRVLDREFERESIIGARKVHTALITDSPPLPSQSHSLKSMSSTSSSMESSLHSAPPQSPNTVITELSPESPNGPEHDQDIDRIGRTSITISRLSLSPPSFRSSSESNNGTNGTPTRQPRARAQTHFPIPSNLSPKSKTPSPGSRQRAQSSVQDISGRRDSENMDVFDAHSLSNASTPNLNSNEREQDAFSKGSFVDPLLIRKKERERRDIGIRTSTAIGKKLPVGQLVAFFDSEKR